MLGKLAKKQVDVVLVEYVAVCGKTMPASVDKGGPWRGGHSVPDEIADLPVEDGFDGLLGRRLVCGDHLGHGFAIVCSCVPQAGSPIEAGQNQPSLLDMGL